MKASLEWLRAFLPLDEDPARVRDLITAHTTTVDEVVPLRTDLAPIVVARVVEARPHPDSDHLWLTRVDAGGGALLEVVCGAPNVTAGRLYPFAQTGTTMPNGMKIERRKIRGIVSNGMLCSARELGLGEDQAGILELNIDAAPGTPFLDAMPVGDVTLVLDVGANRADLQSHLGIARELSTITGRPWRLPDLPALGPELPSAKRVESSARTGGATVTVEEDTRTRRYLGAVIKGVTIGPSPEWLVRRLSAIGVRSINNVVDATNYVLHEVGQPIHAFDLARLAGPSVIVRRARKDERLVTLDGAERKLPQEAVVIADAAGAQALAGIMGGRESEVTDATRDLFIEVACFDPKLTRVTRKSVGLATDASYRFERGVDAELGPLALDRVCRLIVALAGGALADAPVDVARELPAPKQVTLRAARLAQVLGDPVSLAEARRFLEGAGFTVESSNDRELRVRVPSWRADVHDETDLIEEVARFRGYDSFSDEIRPFRPSTTHDDPLWATSNRVREAMVALGFLEARPLPWVSGGQDHVRISNPLAETEAYLRRSILETLGRRTEFNLSHRLGDIRLFELGSTFAPSNGGGRPREELRLGVVMMGRRRPAHFTEPDLPVIDEWDAKGVAETVGRVAYPGESIALAPAPGGDGETLWNIERTPGDIIGAVGRISLDAPVWAAPAFAIELRLGIVESAPPAARGAHTYMEAASPPRPAVRQYQPLPTMPPAGFDLALTVPDGVTAADIERTVRSAAGELLERLELFDQYTGAGIEVGHRSLAWRLTFRHPERTLRDREIEGRRAKILGALEQELHVRQRST